MEKTYRQPRDALNPSAFSAEAAEKWALDRAINLPGEFFRLKAFWYIKFIFQPSPADRKTIYSMRLAHTKKYGMSVGLTPNWPDPDPNLVGQDARRVLRARLCRDYIDRIAIVDSVIGHVSRPPDEEIRLEGSPCAKYAPRMELFATEAKKAIHRKHRINLKANRPHVVLIGASADIISTLARHGFRVSASDLWPEAVGKDLGGVKVQNGKTANAGLMKNADLAIITGLTLANRTLRGLVRLAKRHNTSTLIWAITGRNFGHYYTEHGIDTVISDPSPFVHLPGPSNVGIWRRTT